MAKKSRNSEIVVPYRGRRIKWHWIVVGATMVGVILAEYIDHAVPGYIVPLEFEFLRETILYGIILPLAGGVLFELLERAETAQRRALEDLERQQTLGVQLANASSWEQLTRLIVQFPSTILPTVATSLMLYRYNGAQIEFVTEWRLDGKIRGGAYAGQTSNNCLACENKKFPLTSILVPCDYQLREKELNVCRRFCFPLVHGDRCVAILHVDFPPDMTLGLNQIRVLSGIIPEIALALDRALIQRNAIQQAVVSEAERKKVAQELHDTLGQNIAYLRLKLEQLTGDDAITGIALVQEELERMRQIATEAYQQVRGTLNDLNIDSISEFSSMVQDRVRVFQEQTKIRTSLAITGVSRWISPHMKRQALYICREALSNIEKHSGAKNVQVELGWEDTGFTLFIQDDGSGFEVTAPSPDGHFGMEIMRERAEDIQATLEFSSSPGKGTKVTLKVPISEIDIPVREIEIFKP